VDVAVDGDAEHTRFWLELWGKRQCTLSKSMPKLHWRSLAPFVAGTDEEIKAVEGEVNAAINFPRNAFAPYIPATP
jgi:hypothetical protein